MKRARTDYKNIRQQLFTDNFGEPFLKFYGRRKLGSKWGEVLLPEAQSPEEAVGYLLKLNEKLAKDEKKSLIPTITTCIGLADAKRSLSKKYGISPNNHASIRRYVRPYWDKTHPDDVGPYGKERPLTNFNMALFRAHLDTVDVLRAGKPTGKTLAPQSIKHTLLAAGKLLAAAGIPFEMPEVKIDNIQDYTITDGDLIRLFAEADKRGGDLPDILMFFSNTGARRSEAIKLEWQDVNFDGNEITFRNTKNGKDHTIPLTRELSACLEARKHKSKYVFPGRDGGRRNSGALSRLFGRLKMKCSLPKNAQPIHGLRSKFASSLSAGGVPIADIKELMNHADISTTMRYVRGDNEIQKRGVADLGAKFEGLRGAKNETE